MIEIEFYGAGQGSTKFYEMTDWCKENLYEPNWHAEFPFIFFNDEQEYVWFMMRWSI